MIGTVTGPVVVALPFAVDAGALLLAEALGWAP
jgi:hypothetical protein